MKTIPLISSASNDLLWTDTGVQLVDLFSAYGTNWLGHGHHAVLAAMQAALSQPWSLGGLRHPMTARVEAALQRLCPPGMRSAGLYSTGMEVVEFAMRIARVHTGRTGVIGFARSMHGKSTATANLCWDNGDDFVIPHLHRLPYVDQASEVQILEQVEQHLKTGSIGAIFLEVLQGSNAGWEASTEWTARLATLARRYGVLLICDEILTGFYRTGPCFRFQTHGLQPDMVLFGKACGNGFPVGGLYLQDAIELTPKMLQGSTFSGNQLACVAVASTLEAMAGMDCPALVDAISHIVQAQLGVLSARHDVVLRGCGALWFIEVPTTAMAKSIVQQCFENGVCIGYYGRILRLLPAMTIHSSHLAQACGVLARLVLQELDTHA